MRIVRVGPQDALPDLEDCFDGIIDRLTRGTRLDFCLVKAQIRKESFFNPIAVSPTGPIGLCQFTLATWIEFDGRNVPRTDVFGSIERQVRKLLRIYGWTDAHAISGVEADRFAVGVYNSGEGNIGKAMRKAEELKTNPRSWDDVLAALYLVNRDRANEVGPYVEEILRWREVYAGRRPRPGPLLPSRDDTVTT